MKRIGLLIAVAITVMAPGLRTQAESLVLNGSSEYLVKAGFIYNFAKLVQWPQAAFTQAHSPIIIGVLENDQFAEILHQVVAGKKIDGRPFIVKRMVWGNDLKDCNILFIGSDSRRGEEIVQMLKGTSVLTIAEAPGSAKRGVMINFILENSKVQFEVNLEAANEAALSISSRLLSLARVVKGRTF